MSDTTVPVWLHDGVISVEVLTRSEAKELIGNPYDLQPEDAIRIVKDTTDLPDELVEKLEMQVVSRIAQHALPDPGITYE